MATKKTDLEAIAKAMEEMFGDEVRRQFSNTWYDDWWDEQIKKMEKEVGDE